MYLIGLWLPNYAKLTVCSDQPWKLAQSYFYFTMELYLHHY